MNQKLPGYTVNEMIGKLTMAASQGYGNCTVMMQDFHSRTIRAAGEGIIGLANDGRQVLVIMPDETIVAPKNAINLGGN